MVRTAILKSGHNVNNRKGREMFKNDGNRMKETRIHSLYFSGSTEVISLFAQSVSIFTF